MPGITAQRGVQTHERKPRPRSALHLLVFAPHAFALRVKQRQKISQSPFIKTTRNYLGVATRVCRGKVKQYRLESDDMPHGEALPVALKKIGRQVMDLLNDPGVVSMHRLLASECMSHPSLAQAFLEAGPEPTLAAITDYLLANDIPSGRFGDGRHAAEVFFVLLQHKEMMYRVLDLVGPMSEQAREDHVERVVDQFLRIYS